VIDKAVMKYGYIREKLFRNLSHSWISFHFARPIRDDLSQIRPQFEHTGVDVGENDDGVV
jgi:hypothetical protein